ncbi:hypothetical protein [Salmon gill poxvirus]
MIWFFLSIFVSAHISYVISTGQRVDTSILLLSSQSQQTASPIQSGNSTGVQSIISYIQTLAQPLGFLGVALGSIVTYVVTPFKKAIGSIISVLASIKTLGIKGYIMKLQKTHLGIDQNDILNSMKSIVPGKKEPPDSDPPPESDPTENDQLNVKKIDINTRSMDDTKVNMGDTKVNMGDTTGLPRLSLNRIMSNPSYRSLEKDSNYISLGNDRFYRDQERPYQERPYKKDLMKDIRKDLMKDIRKDTKKDLIIRKDLIRKDTKKDLIRKDLIRKDPDPRQYTTPWTS